MYYTDLTPYEYDKKQEFQSILDNITELQGNIQLISFLNLIVGKNSAFKLIAFINSLSKFHISRRILDKMILSIIECDNYDHFRNIVFWTTNYKIRLTIAKAFLNAVNVGWLKSGHRYPTGDTLTDFHAKLFQFCLYPHWGHRGYYQCALKPCTGVHETLTITIDNSVKKEHLPNMGMLIASHGGTTNYLGSKVIIVIGKNRNYAAPDLIYHYVTDHHYLPPDEFIDAVMESEPHKCRPAWS